jgi:hypothetical protein
VRALILESDDIALANRHAVSGIIIDAIRGREDVPDMILLVEWIEGWESSCELRRTGTLFIRQQLTAQVI